MRIKKGGAFQVSSFAIFNYLHNYRSKHLENRGSWKAAFSSKPAKEKHLSALHSIIAIVGTICLKLCWNKYSWSLCLLCCSSASSALPKLSVWSDSGHPAPKGREPLGPCHQHLWVLQGSFSPPLASPKVLSLNQSSFFPAIEISP